MKLVTQTCFCSVRFGDEKAIRLIKKVGFDGYDFSMFEHNMQYWDNDNYLEYAKHLREVSDEVGLPCLQMHAPFGDMTTIDLVLSLHETLIKSIEFAHILGTKIIVIHPGTLLTAAENKKYLYDGLLPKAKEYGITIATENMWINKPGSTTETVPAACGTCKDFVEHIDTINDNNFKACLDLGHAQMVNCEGAVALIKALGKSRLCCLHVHDNDNYHDDHFFPFQGKSNWTEICGALKEIGYDGHFTFEADYTLAKYPSELYEDALKLLHATGRYLINLIES